MRFDEIDFVNHDFHELRVIRGQWLASNYTFSLISDFTNDFQLNSTKHFAYMEFTIYSGDKTHKHVHV